MLIVNCGSDQAGMSSSTQPPYTENFVDYLDSLVGSQQDLEKKLDSYQPDSTVTPVPVIPAVVRDSPPSLPPQFSVCSFSSLKHVSFI